nr:retrotransposon protein, putative, Ty1-copia subclass [Tanacetum cinerariifolium]
MMSQTTLPKSFWDYTLETGARILNMIPTKKVEKTPYEVWHGQAPKLSYLKVWGCKALVKRDTLTKPDKLEPRSIKCTFIGYPKVRYSFYYPPKNKVLVARNAEFLENSLINQEATGSLEDLEIIQEEDTHPSIDTSLNHEEDDLEIDEPQSDIVPIRRSTRTRHAPNHMCLYIDDKEHELRDLDEPANYKAALFDPEFEKWLNAMNVEMQSMKDNEVCVLVELSPNGKTVGSKWLFKKKTDMDRVVHTYKARLVAKGYTQTPGIDYVETFSPVADIRAIMILIAIAAYYDYEIWQMDVKTVFLNGYLNEEVYMEQSESFVNPKYPNRIYRDRSRRLSGLCQSAYIKKILNRYCMENSKRESILMKEKLKLSKSQGASTPAEVKRMQNVSYASAVGSTINTKDMFLVYGGDLKRELRVSCYTDTGYLTDADDLKSQTEYVFVLNGGAVDRKSAKQSIFATSSAEAKYIAAFDASKEAVWVSKFISGLGVVPTIEELISMYCDNNGAIAIGNESGITKGARHFRARVHYLREVIQYGDIKLEKVHTDDNLADPFTKALAFPKHSKHTRNIGMLPASSPYMVRSMMNLTTLPLSFWDYALESATRILNMVSTKKVDKTPYELWYGKVPNLSYLRFWGCEALVKLDTPDKLQQRSVKCFEPPQEEDISIRRFERTRRAPNRLSLNVEIEEHSLGDLNEPTSYKAAMLDYKSNKWIDAMNAEIQSMMDNMVWVLVDLPPGCKTIGREATFILGIKIYRDMSKRLIGLGQNAYMDKILNRYKMDNSKCGHIPMQEKLNSNKTQGETTFILGTKIYRDMSKRLIGLGQNAYMDKILKRYKMDNSKCGHIPMQEKLNSNKTQGASTPKEVKRMQNVPYASVVGSIMYAVRCSRPDVAFAQNITSRFQQNPGESHWTAMKIILKYLKNTKDMFLVYSGNPKDKL